MFNVKFRLSNNRKSLSVLFKFANSDFGIMLRGRKFPNMIIIKRKNKSKIFF